MKDKNEVLDLRMAALWALKFAERLKTNDAEIAWDFADEAVAVLVDESTRRDRGSHGPR